MPQAVLQSSNAAQSILASFWKADPANFEIRRDMAVIQSQIAAAYDAIRDDTPAEDAHRKGLAIYQKLQWRNPKSDRSHDDLAGARNALGQWLTRHGRQREALEHFSAARAAFDKLMQRNPNAGFDERKMVRSIGGLADVHMKLGDRVTACGEYRDALALASRLQAAGRLKASDQNERPVPERTGGLPIPLAYPKCPHVFPARHAAPDLERLPDIAPAIGYCLFSE